MDWGYKINLLEFNLFGGGFASGGGLSRFRNPFKFLRFLTPPPPLGGGGGGGVRQVLRNITRRVGSKS